jgi:predicted amidohydrolase
MLIIYKLILITRGMAKISAAQIEISHGDLEDNVRRICSFMEQAKGSNIICFPELCISGVYRPENGEREAAIARIMAKAGQIGIWATVGSYAKRGSKTFNELYLLSNKGHLAYTYQKKHPWIEEYEVTAGTKNKAIEADFGIIGLLNCYDIRYPEEADNLAKGGAKIILCSSYWPKEYSSYNGYPEKTAARCNALVVMCDAANMDTVGQSKIVSPIGILAKAKGEQLISVEHKI